MRAVLYVRVSLEEGEQYGLAAQLRELQERAKQKGYSIVETFKEDGYLGGDLDRPSLTRLRDLARSGGMDVVLVHDPDRLSRKLGHMILLRDEFEARNVRLEFITTQADMTPEGKMFLNLKGVFGEYEREKIRERTLRGRREKAKQGYIVGGVSPYGYRYEGKSAGHRGRFVVDEEQAATVRQIFAWSLEGISIREIATRLRTAGIAPKKSAAWAKSSVSNILRNETYAGRAYYNRRQNTEPEVQSAAHRARRDKKTLTRMRGASEWISVEVPPIISRGVFDAVAAQLRKNAEVLVGKPARSYLLRGLLWCGLCEKRLYTCPSHGTRYYRCASRDRLTAAACKSGLVHAEKTESRIWEAISGPLCDPAKLRALIAQRTADLVPKRDDPAEAQRLARQLEQLKRREFRATQGMLDAELGDHHAAFRAQLIEAQKQRRKVEQRLSEISAGSAPPSDIDAACLAISKIVPLLKDANRAEFLRRVVSSIKVFGEQAEIRCAIPTEGYRPQCIDGVDDNKPRLGFIINVKIA